MSSLQPQNCSLSIIIQTELVIISTSEIDIITQKYEKYFYFSASGKLTLSLFVLRVFTDNSDAALSFNDFAFFTNWFN